MPRCTAKTNAGKRCKKDAINDTDYCHTHKDYDERLLSTIDEDVAQVQAIQEEVVESPPPPVNFVIEPMQVSNTTFDIPISFATSEAPSVSNVSNVSNISEDYVKQLMDRISSLTIENNMLRRNRAVSHTRKRSVTLDTKTIEEKSMIMFYHDKKKDQGVITTVRNQLAERNMLFTRPKKVYGGVVEKEIIPWVYVKQCTDYMWNQLSEDQKNVYCNKVIKKYQT